jgi:hypothetical protein
VPLRDKARWLPRYFLYPSQAFEKHKHAAMRDILPRDRKSQIPTKHEAMYYPVTSRYGIPPLRYLVLQYPTSFVSVRNVASHPILRGPIFHNHDITRIMLLTSCVFFSIADVKAATLEKRRYFIYISD